MPDFLTDEEHEIVRKGSEYEALKNQPAFRTLVNYLAGYCNTLLEDIEKFDDLDPVYTARLVDRWKASLKLYHLFQVEIQSSIDNANEILARLKGEPDGR